LLSLILEREACASLLFSSSLEELLVVRDYIAAKLARSLKRLGCSGLLPSKHSLILLAFLTTFLIIYHNDIPLI